jgi:hypothetical protein
MRWLLFTLVLALAVPASPSAVVSAQAVTFLATWQNAYFRTAPSVLAPTIAPLVQGSRYDVTARTQDGQWVALAGPGLAAWLPAGFGEITGDLADVPVVQPALPAFATNINSAALPGWIRTTERGRAMLRQSARAGRDPRMFTIAGDSNSTWQRSIGRIAAGTYDIGARDFLRVVIARFDPSFSRVSTAVGGGYRAADMFEPAMARPKGCLIGEGMFECELRQSHACVVFIQLGTGDKFAWREYEANLRAMIEHALAQSVVPVLVTKADDMESIQGGAGFNYINDTIRALAAEYQLPLIDFYVASRGLPTVPNPDLPKRPFTQFGLHDEWGYYFHLTDEGFALKVLGMLFMLDALTRA